MLGLITLAPGSMNIPGEGIFDKAELLGTIAKLDPGAVSGAANCVEDIPASVKEGGLRTMFPSSIMTVP